MIDRFLGDDFGALSRSCPFWSTVLQCGVHGCRYTHLKLLDRAVSGARFLTVGVFECDIAHRRSVTILCMLSEIGCNPVHPFNGVLPGPYVPVRVTSCTLDAHWYVHSCASSLQNTAVPHDFYSPLSVPL